MTATRRSSRWSPADVDSGVAGPPRRSPAARHPALASAEQPPGCTLAAPGARTPGQPRRRRRGRHPDQPDDTGSARQARAERAARRLILKAAADLLSGPGGLASYLRTRLAPGRSRR